jgi:hypothetical protein
LGAIPVTVSTQRKHPAGSPGAADPHHRGSAAARALGGHRPVGPERPGGHPRHTDGGHDARRAASRTACTPTCLESPGRRPDRRGTCAAVGSCRPGGRPRRRPAGTSPCRCVALSMRPWRHQDKEIPALSGNAQNGRASHIRLICERIRRWSPGLESMSRPMSELSRWLLHPGDELASPGER